jgi:hypothetical protein
MTKPSNARSLLSATDSLIALALAVGAVIWANQQRMPQGGLSEFLEMRITALNASFAIVFAVLWRQCMRSASIVVLPSCSVPRLRPLRALES